MKLYYNMERHIEESILYVRHMPMQRPRRKRLFLIRHGESMWNEASESFQIHKMLTRVDHPLNKTGISQVRGETGR